MTPEQEARFSKIHLDLLRAKRVDMMQLLMNIDDEITQQEKRLGELAAEGSE